MGNVLQFPKERARKKRRQAQPKPGWYRDRDGWKVWRHFRINDLGSARPWRHPRKVPRGPRGGIQMAVGQVWVEIHTAELWVISELIPQKNKRFRVRLLPYRCRDMGYMREYSQVTFRSIMMVWDDYIVFHAQLFSKWRRETERHGLNIARAAQFFGIDHTTGFRIR